MALEDTLLTYGPLGAWTLWLLYLQLNTMKEQKEERLRMSVLIENNTIALTKCSDAMNTCPIKEAIRIK